MSDEGIGAISHLSGFVFVCYLPNRHAVQLYLFVTLRYHFAFDGFLSSATIMVLDAGVVKGYDALHNYTCS